MEHPNPWARAKAVMPELPPERAEAAAKAAKKKTTAKPKGQPLAAKVKGHPCCRGCGGKTRLRYSGMRNDNFGRLFSRCTTDGCGQFHTWREDQAASQARVRGGWKRSDGWVHEEDDAVAAAALLGLPPGAAAAPILPPPPLPPPPPPQRGFARAGGLPGFLPPVTLQSMLASAAGGVRGNGGGNVDRDGKASSAGMGGFEIICLSDGEEETPQVSHRGQRKLGAFLPSQTSQPQQAMTPSPSSGHDAKKPRLNEESGRVCCRGSGGVGL